MTFDPHLGRSQTLYTATIASWFSGTLLSSLVSPLYIQLCQGIMMLTGRGLPGIWKANLHQFT